MLADKEQWCIATSLMINVSLAGSRLFRGGTLRLPMKKTVANGVVLVHCCWGIVGFSLIEGYEKRVNFSVCEMEYAGLVIWPFLKAPMA